MTREKVRHYPDFVRLFHTSTRLRSMELGMRKESGLFHISTPQRSVELRMKKESRDLVASAGHLWSKVKRQSKGQNDEDISFKVCSLSLRQRDKNSQIFDDISIRNNS